MELFLNFLKFTVIQQPDEVPSPFLLLTAPPRGHFPEPLPLTRLQPHRWLWPLCSTCCRPLWSRLRPPNPSAAWETPEGVLADSKGALAPPTVPHPPPVSLTSVGSSTFRLFPPFSLFSSMTRAPSSSSLLPSASAFSGLPASPAPSDASSFFDWHQKQNIPDGVRKATNLDVGFLNSAWINYCLFSWFVDYRSSQHGLEKLVCHSSKRDLFFFKFNFLPLFCFF